MTFVRKLIEMDEESGLVQKAKSWNIMSNSGMGSWRSERGRVCSRDNPEPVRAAIVSPTLQTVGQKVAYLECH